jgi:hypothetical protein
MSDLPADPFQDKLQFETRPDPIRERRPGFFSGIPFLRIENCNPTTDSNSSIVTELLFRLKVEKQS